MTKQQVNLTFYTPSWNWCEVRNPGRNTKSGERCRFCQEVKKRGDATRYVCVIYNTDLSVRDGSVRKCQRCLSMGSIVDTIHEPAPEVPTGKASDTYRVVKATLKEHNKEYKTLRKNGFPEYIAYDSATAAILDAWKESTPTRDEDFSWILE